MWQPTPVFFLPGESHGQRSLAGCSPWGLKESDTTEATCHGSGNREAYEEGERWENGWLLEKSEHTLHLLLKLEVLHGHSSWHPQITAVTLQITAHGSSEQI